MSLHAAYTRYLIAKIDTGDSIEGIHLEPVPWATIEPSYRLHLGPAGNGYPVYLGNEAEAIHQLDSAAEKVREVADLLKAKETRLTRFLSRV
jgi:hypothetical protein